MTQAVRFVMAALLLIIGCGATSMSSDVDETQKTTAALTAIEHHWLQAESHGDVAYVDQLLAPEYRSVNADGSVHPKSVILASTRKNERSDKMAKMVAAYQRLYPSGMLIKIDGDSAVVTFYQLSRGPEKGVSSSDIFAYNDGHWHAIYSQHTSLK